METTKKNKKNTFISKKNKKENELIDLLKKAQKALSPYFEKGILTHPK